MVTLNELERLSEARQVRLKVVEGSELWEELTADGGWTEKEIGEAVYILTEISHHHEEIFAECPELNTGEGLDGHVSGFSSDFDVIPYTGDNPKG